MFQSATRVPVTLGDLYGGFAKATGLLILEGEHLLLEYQIKDELFGALKGKPRSFRIPLTALDSVEYKKNFFGTKLMIRVLRLRDLDGIPNSEKGEVKLKISRKDRPQAEAVASAINYRLSELRLDEMGEL